MKNIWVLLTLSILSVSSCTYFNFKRAPASFDEEVVSKRPMLSFNLSFDKIQFGFKEAVKNSKIIESVNHFYMDPVTRIFSINMDVNYPMDKLLDFTLLPKEERLSDEHNIELSFRFSKTKNLAISRYLGMQITKFKIDGDDYLNQFDIILAVIQTILANSELTDYLLVKNRALLPSDDMVNMVKEIFESQTIRVFPETKKINIKLDLAMFNALGPYKNQVRSLRLWRFSPSIYETRDNPEGVSFFIVVGEGRPHKQWMNSQQEIIKDDTRTLLQVRQDLFQEYSDIDGLMNEVHAYLKKLLDNEEIKLERISKQYQIELTRFIKSIRKKADKTLSVSNDHFVASPEYEFLILSEQIKKDIRNYIAQLDRKLSIDYNILQGGDKTSNKKPMVTQRISQNLLNKGMNFFADIDYKGNQMFDELNIWLLPQKNGFALKGIINLPLKFILGNIDKGLLNTNYESKILETKEGFPFELIFTTKMGDHGKLGLDIEQLKVQVNGKKLYFTRNSKNHQFLMDFAKAYMAKTMSSLKLDLSKEINPELKKKFELKKIISYLAELKSAYTGLSSKKIEDILLSDLKMNPFNLKGKDYVLMKQEILFKDIVSYNDENQLFVMNIDPKIAIDNINNVKNTLEVWGITPVYSKELNNTFLELTIGDGLRSSQFISDLSRRNGVAENTLFSGIYYDIGKDRSSVDMLISMHFDYFTPFVNRFLKDMVAVNNTDVERQAREDQGERKFEILDADFKITNTKKLKVQFRIKTAVFGRSITSFSSWFKPKLVTDNFTFSTDMILQAKEVPLNNTSLKNLRYYSQAINIIPSNVKILSGSPSMVHKAITKLLSSASSLSLNNGTVKKLLLKMVNKTMNKMYSKDNGKILGHELEKYVRVQTTNTDILLLLNPKLAGPAFNVHLAGDDINEAQKTAIKITPEDRTMHFALTSGVGMARSDKLKLINIYKDLNEYLLPFEKAGTKDKLIKILKGQDFAQKLVKNNDKSKRSFYNRFVYILSKYNPVLNVTRLGNNISFNDQTRLQQDDQDITSKSELTRISASGSELIYFAAIGHYLHKKLNSVTEKMNRLGLNTTQYGFQYLKDSRDILKQNITNPLLKKYEQKNLQINKTIISNKVSYWTFQVYPDAYFANEVYHLIKND